MLILPAKLLFQANLPKEISDYLNKMSARVPRIKPGRATVDYLTKIQTSTRFWGRCP
jgi:preprotein translocase subunit SecY